jgi:type II secretory ATPase GspE/PulE/Tfp pilus assembly ATPase PilB-like protein
VSSVFRDDIAKYIAKYVAARSSSLVTKQTPTQSTDATTAMTPKLTPRSAKFLGRQGELKPHEDAIGAVLDEVVDEGLDENDGTVVRLVNQLVSDAAKAGISDIHIEPYGPKKEVVVRYRMDGVCYEHTRIPAEYARPLVSRLKVLSRLDIAERRKPQDGKFKFRLSDREVELRIATIPTSSGDEDAVLRILASNEPLPLNKLNLTQRNQQELTKVLERPHGMILCVGPTGSGKTTTCTRALVTSMFLDGRSGLRKTQSKSRNPDYAKCKLHPKLG